MARTLDAEYRAQTQAKQCRPVWLVDFYVNGEASAPERYTNCPESVTWGGNTYNSFPLSIGGIQANLTGRIDKMALSLSNLDGTLSAYIEANDGLRGVKAVLTQVFLDLLDDADAYWREVFYVESTAVALPQVDFMLSTKWDVLLVELPRRLYNRGRCHWAFKGTECGYAGAATSCDKTVETCSSYTNEGRFGGFPNVPSTRRFV